MDSDKNSNEAQGRHIMQVRGQLILLGVAAISGAFSWQGDSADWPAVVGALAFGAAILVRLFAEQQQDEREWYESRAAAESAKTLCWRFAVAGAPFPDSLTDDAAKALLVRRFADISSELKYIDVSASSAIGGEVTPPMWDLRHASRQERIDSYGRDRICLQQGWYASKSSWNEKRARTWLKVVLAIEGIGLVGAVLKATEYLSVDVLGICSALAASSGAWLQTRQHRTLAAAYNVTARELRQVATLMDEGMSAEEWADFVDQAEEAISREHTMWVASRTGRRLHLK